MYTRNRAAKTSESTLNCEGAGHIFQMSTNAGVEKRAGAEGPAWDDEEDEEDEGVVADEEEEGEEK